MEKTASVSFPGVSSAVTICCNSLFHIIGNYLFLRLLIRQRKILVTLELLKLQLQLALVTVFKHLMDGICQLVKKVVKIFRLTKTINNESHLYLIM